MSAHKLDPKRAKRRRYEAGYRQKNRKHLREIQRKCDQKRSQTSKRKKFKYKNNKKYRKNNPEKVQAWGRRGTAKYRSRHPKKVAETKRRYMKNNPHKNKQWKRKQKETLSPGYVNELLKKKGISPNRSKEFNEVYAIRIKINRVLNQKK